jgi:hypothetical protein
MRLKTLPLSPGVVFVSLMALPSPSLVSAVSYVQSTLGSRTTTGVQQTGTSPSHRNAGAGDQRGLGVGAKAGIGIVAAFGALLLSALVFSF